MIKITDSKQPLLTELEIRNSIFFNSKDDIYEHEAHDYEKMASMIKLTILMLMLMMMLLLMMVMTKRTLIILSIIVMILLILIIKVAMKVIKTIGSFYDLKRNTSQNWIMVLKKSELQNKLKLNLICASSFDNNFGSSLIWLSSLTNKKFKLYYMPSFEKFKCPKSKSKLISVACCTFHLLLLFEGGKLWLRKEMSHSQPLGKKWIKISKVPTLLTQISANQNDLICWCCDNKGQAWILSLESLLWYQVFDQFIVIKSISVPSKDSSIVWCLDQNGYTF